MSEENSGMDEEVKYKEVNEVSLLLIYNIVQISEKFESEFYTKV